MSKLTLTREYNSSIVKVWKALTTPEIIKQYWAPPGMKTVVATIDDLKVGGVFIYSMQSDNGNQMWVRCTYTQVEEPNKLSFMESMANEDGEAVAPSTFGMPGDEIKESLTEITLEEQDGVTTLTMVIDYGDDQSNEYASKGWTGMLENLTTIVE